MVSTLAVLGGLAVLAVSVPVVLAAGWAAVTGATFSQVKTGSMAPTIPVGSVVVVRPVDVGRVAPGTVIVFERPDQPGVLITHRVTQVLDRNEGRFFQTKGDANPTKDSFVVPARSVRGRVAQQLRGFAWMYDIVASRTGRLMAFTVPFALLVLGESLGRRRDVAPATHELALLRSRRAPQA